MRTFLSEAFKALDLLEEDKFDISKNDEFDKFKLFMEDDSDEDVLTVIDADAENEDEIEDSYDGKIICDCPVCHSKVFKDLKDIILNDDDDLANVGEECPYCYSVDGFKVIGEVAPFHRDYDATATDKDGNPVDVEVSVDEDEVKLEALKRRIRRAQRINESRRRRRNEALEKLDLETENDLIHVTAETKDEQVVPVDMNTQEEIEMEQPINDADLDSSMEGDEEIPEDEEIGDEVDVEEFDEESFDELGESYLRQVYNNVKGFKTTRILEYKNSLIVEGLIKFNSGNSKKTSFRFSDYEVGKKNNLRLIGENLNMKTGKKSFRLAGKVRNNKFLGEKLYYNYRQGKDSIRGVVKRK